MRKISIVFAFMLLLAACQRGLATHAVPSLSKANLDANDLTTVEAVSATLKELASAIRSSNPDLTVVELWPQVQKDAKMLVSKYDLNLGSQGADREMLSKIVAMKADYLLLETDIDGPLTARMGNTILAKVQNLKDYIQNAKQTSNFTYFVHLIPECEIQLRNCMTTYTLLGSRNPAFTNDVLAQAAAQLASTTETAELLTQEIIASNSVCKEEYSGPDVGSLKSTLRAKFQEANPKSKILKVVIQGAAWTRMKSWRWSPSLAWYKEDMSVLGAQVIIAGDDPDQAFRYSASFVRDHLHHNVIRAAVPKQLKEPSPSDVLLRSKVK